MSLLSASRPPHQQRVIDEQTELDEKRQKLEAFFTNPIFAKLPTDERERLSRQAEIMKQYSQVLGERIASF